MLRISSGVASLSAQRAFNQTQRDTSQALKELATGTRFASPGADPAGLAIAEGLNAQARGYKAALSNTENASSFLSVAEGSLSEQSNVIIRLRELAVQAASDTLSDRERGYLDIEAQQLTQEFDRIAKSTRYGSQNLLDGSTKNYEFQVGLRKGSENVIKYTSDTDTTASNLDLDGLSVADKDDARDALDTLDEALSAVSGGRAKLGAIQSRLNTAVSHLQTQTEEITNAYSKQSDTDIPDAVARMRRGQVLAQYQAAALQASNEADQSYLRLIA